MMSTLAPRELSPDQRLVLGNLVERMGGLRGSALFALGYWAGCRVSDIAYLRAEDAHTGPKIGWIHVGHKGGKVRDIDLLNAARRPLYEYLQPCSQHHLGEMISRRVSLCSSLNVPLR